MRRDRSRAVEQCAAVARRHAGAVSRSMLAAVGVDAGDILAMVGAGFLVPVTHRVLRIAGSPNTRQQRLWIGVLDAAPGAVVSHRSAARLHHIGRLGFDGVDVLELEPVAHRGHVAVRHRTTYLPNSHRTVVDGLPTTTVARTVFDLAGLASARRRWRGLPSLTDRQVERALDDALVRTLSMSQLDAVSATLAGRGRPGTRLIRALAEPRREGFAATESELEDLVLAVLHRFGRSEPDRQVRLGGDALAGRVDFTFSDARVVLEADGRRHHTALLDADADRWRDLELAAAGFLVVRVTWRQLHDDGERFITHFERLLERRRRQFAA